MIGSSVVRWVRTVALVAAAGLAVYAITAQWDDVSDAASDVGVVRVLGSLVAVLVGLGASALSWRALLADLGQPLSAAATGRVFFLGQLGKYLPGGIWPVVAQMELGREEGAARSRVGAAALVVMAVNVTTGLVVAGALLPFAWDDSIGRAAWLFALLPLGVVALHPRVLSAVVGRGLQWSKQQPLDRPLTVRGVGAAVGWASVMWAAYGVHLLVLLPPLTDDDGLVLLATGGYALAWTAGFLTVVAPAGAAAREAMLVVVLASALSTGAATAVAVLSRVLMTVGDVVWAVPGATAATRGIRDVRGYREDDP